jgi:hypothetical protein
MSWKTSKLNKQPDEDGVGSIFMAPPWKNGMADFFTTVTGNLSAP